MTIDASTSNAMPVNAPEGHDAAMAAKADAALAQKPDEQPAGTTQETPTVPDWVPEKFRSAEDPMKAMAQAYAELESKQSGKPDETTQDTPTTPEAAKEMVAKAGLDFAALNAEYAEKGALSPETFDALAKAGIPKATVDAYISGQEAIAQQHITDVMGSVGGEEAYGLMVNWAASNMDRAEIEAFNKVIDAGDVSSIKLTIAGIKARYDAANGSEPKLLNGGNSTGEQDVFRSTAELTAAMKDPRYAKDAAYRADIEAKVSRSSIF